MFAIPLVVTARSGTLVSLPPALAEGMRNRLQGRFPHGTAIRLTNRVVPQLRARAMGAQALYELVEELTRGACSEADAPGAFVPHGRSLGQHYLFALAITAHPAEVLLEMLGDLQSEPGLVKRAAAQTERITSEFAERRWPLLMRVSAPRRLREMLASTPVLGDVRELDALLEHAAAPRGTPVVTLKAELSLARTEEGALRIAISDRADGTPLAHALYRLAGLGAEASAYR